MELFPIWVKALSVPPVAVTSDRVKSVGAELKLKVTSEVGLLSLSEARRMFTVTDGPSVSIA